jgi:hypothetical protein
VEVRLAGRSRISVPPSTTKRIYSTEDAQRLEPLDNDDFRLNCPELHFGEDRPNIYPIDRGFHVDFSMLASTPGSGSVEFIIRPDEDPEEGAAGCTMNINVVS